MKRACGGTCWGRLPTRWRPRSESGNSTSRSQAIWPRTFGKSCENCTRAFLTWISQISILCFTGLAFQCANVTESLPRKGALYRLEKLYEYEAMCVAANWLDRVVRTSVWWVRFGFTIAGILSKNATRISIQLPKYHTPFEGLARAQENSSKAINSALLPNKQSLRCSWAPRYCGLSEDTARLQELPSVSSFPKYPAHITTCELTKATCSRKETYNVTLRPTYRSSQHDRLQS